jgi:hypothetical protein
MRVSGRRIHVLRNVTTQSEVLAHRENQILFHNRFLLTAGYGWGAGFTPRKLAFASQKLCTLIR